MKYHCKNPMMHQRRFIYANLIWTCEVKVKTHCLSSLGCTIISTRCEQRISPRYCTSDHNNSIELTTSAEEICPNILFLQIWIPHIPCIPQNILDPYVLPSSWLLRYPLHWLVKFADSLCFIIAVISPIYFEKKVVVIEVMFIPTRWMS